MNDDVRVTLTDSTRAAMKRIATAPATAAVARPRLAAAEKGGAMTDRFYIACSSLEWKLGIHLAEWQAARELAYRMGKAGDDLNQAHLDGVRKLLREHLAELEALSL